MAALFVGCPICLLAQVGEDLNELTADHVNVLGCLTDVDRKAGSAEIDYMLYMIYYILYSIYYIIYYI